jgi:mevalonate kinase
MVPFAMSLSLNLTLTRGAGASASASASAADSANKFNDNYVATWGGSHVAYLNRGSEVQHSRDQSSGAGFSSSVLFPMPPDSFTL